MAGVVLRADAEVQALRRLASRVWAPALSARITARTLPARSTTVAVTAWPLALQAATVALAIWLARSSDRVRSVRTPWAWAWAPAPITERARDRDRAIRVGMFMRGLRWALRFDPPCPPCRNR